MLPDLEELLSQAVQAYFRQGSRVAEHWSPGPMPNLHRVQRGPLGQDLEWLEAVARGDRAGITPEDVAVVRLRVLENLYQPLAGGGPALHPGFSKTPLGQVLAAAEARAAGQQPAAVPWPITTTELGAAALPPVAPPAPELPLEEEPAFQGTAPQPSAVGPVAWLLGEGTIRGVLYLGGLLVVAAATIFVVHNWGTFPGYLKFGSIFLATLGLYLLGYTLYNTPLRTAGVTFIGIGSLVAPLNFYALYQFVLKPMGAPPEGAWILGSAFCCGLYLTTAWWLRSSLLTYAATFALTAAVGAVLSAAKAPGYLYGPVGLTVANLLFVLAQQAEAAAVPQFITAPLRRSALSAGAALTFVLLALSGPPRVDPRWMSTVLGLLLAAVLYAHHGHVTRWLWTRIAAYLLVPLAYILFLQAFAPPTLVAGGAVMALGIAYLALSFTPFFRSYGAKDQWVLRGIGYTLALMTTWLALGRTQDLILALVADVAILAGSAYAYRDQDWWAAWAWGSVWLFVLPWLLILSLRYPASLTPDSRFIPAIWHPAWSLGLALLCANYLVLGAIVRRWTFAVAAGFLSAALTVLPLAALMAAVFPAGISVGAVLFAAAVLVYGAVAVASGRAWLLHGALPLLNVAIWSALNLFIRGPRVDAPITIGSYVALSLVQLYLGRWLEVRGYPRWAQPVYVWGAITMALSFTDALFAALAAGAAVRFRISPHTGLSPQTVTFLVVSVLYGAALLHFAWLQRQATGWLAQGGRSVLVYLGLAVLAGAVGWGVFDTRFAEHHFTVMAGWLLLSALVGRTLPAGDAAQIYGKPLERFTLIVVWLPLILALFLRNPLSVATVYLVAALLYGISAFHRRSRALAYTAGMLMAVAYAGVLQWQRVYEPQAYIIPYSAGVLVAAHLERMGRERYLVHPRELLLALTWSGLTLLYGSALAQSLGPSGSPYLALVVGETVAGLLWGLRTRSRSWVVLSSGFLAGEAFLQVIDEVLSLPAWVLLGGAGALLLIAGVLALAKREEILTMGRATAHEWEAWGL